MDVGATFVNHGETQTQEDNTLPHSTSNRQTLTIGSGRARRAVFFIEYNNMSNAYHRYQPEFYRDPVSR